MYCYIIFSFIILCMFYCNKLMNERRSLLVNSHEQNISKKILNYNHGLLYEVYFIVMTIDWIFCDGYVGNWYLCTGVHTFRIFFMIA